MGSGHGKHATAAYKARLLSENIEQRKKIQALEAEATRWFEPDGSVTTLSPEEVVRLRKQAARDFSTLRHAIRWALGEEGNFGENAPPDDKPRYWWRRELKELCRDALTFPSLVAAAAVDEKPPLPGDGTFAARCPKCRSRVDVENGLIVDHGRVWMRRLRGPWFGDRCEGSAQKAP